MNNTNYELRYVNSNIKNNGGYVEGTSIIFNSESEVIIDKVNGGYIRFNEIIEVDPKEIKKVLDNSDINMLYQHDINSAYGILARSKKGSGSLSYEVDEKGVHFRFKAKQKDAGIIESIEAGDLDGCSFCFHLNENDKSSNKLEHRSSGIPLRHIYKIENIKDFSIVVNPAYNKTSVSLRFLDELEISKTINDVNIEKEKFNRYYNNLVRKYLS